MTPRSAAAIVDPTECERCGQVHTRCVGHVKNGPRAGQPCMRWPRSGVPNCDSHGGAASQVRAAGERRRARLVLASTVAELADDLRPSVEGVHPFDVLLGAVEGAHLMRLVYERLVHQLAPQPTDAEAAERREALYGVDHLGDHRSHPLTADLERWTRVAGDLSAKALAAGIDERRVRLAESQGRLVAEAVGGILADLEGALRELVTAGQLEGDAFRRLVDELVPGFVTARLVAASGRVQIDGGDT